MPAQSDIQSEDAKEYCKTPDRGDIARISSHVGFIMTRGPWIKRAELTITIIWIVREFRYEPLSDVSLVRSAFIENPPVMSSEEVVDDVR